MSDISKLGPMNQLNAGPLSEKKANVTEEKFREVSDMYEQHFIREMMKQMRATVQEGGLVKKNNAEKIFSDQLDDQYATQWGKAGGIGLSTIIYDQLMQRYGTKLGLKAPVEKPHGPIDITTKANFSGIIMDNKGESKDSTTYKFEPVKNEAGAEQPQALARTELKNPWAGTLLDKKYLDADQMRYHIKHDNGLESLIVGRGTGLGPDQQLSPGDAIKTGQQLGWVDSASPLFWTVKPNQTDVSE